MCFLKSKYVCLSGIKNFFWKFVTNYGVNHLFRSNKKFPDIPLILTNSLFMKYKYKRN